MTFLITLDISFNEIKIIPDEIKNLKNLENLFAQNNKIEFISPEISNLKNLEVLNLSCNNIKSLPFEFCELKKLKSINLGENKLKYFPIILGEIKTIEYLNLCFNKNLIKWSDKSTKFILKKMRIINSIKDFGFLKSLNNENEFIDLIINFYK